MTTNFWSVGILSAFQRPAFLDTHICCSQTSFVPTQENHTTYYCLDQDVHPRYYKVAVILNSAKLLPMQG